MVRFNKDYLSLWSIKISGDTHAHTQLHTERTLDNYKSDHVTQEIGNIYQNKVFPLPGGPQISIMAPSSPNPKNLDPGTSSRSLRKVRINSFDLHLFSISFKYELRSFQLHNFFFFTKIRSCGIR